MRRREMRKRKKEEEECAGDWGRRRQATAEALSWSIGEAQWALSLTRA